MNIFIIICTLFPAFISVLICSRKEKDNKKLFLSYFLFSILINISSIFSIILYKRDTNIIIEQNFSYFQFCAKYLLISLVFAVIIPYIVEFVSKNLKISVEIKKGKNEKKDN